MNKTFALNVIVGAGEASLLDRCLTAFDVKKEFDQVVIVSTTNDNSVIETAKKYTSDVYRHQWSSSRHPYGNFADARNEAIKHTTTDYIMWLDTDDLPLAENYTKSIGDLRTKMTDNDIDVACMNYCLRLDANGKQTDGIVRERIWKMSLCAIWKKPVHEQLSIGRKDIKVAIVNGLSILHSPIKPAEIGTNRNIKILMHEYNMNSIDVHNRYYLGRDLYKIPSRSQEAIPILVDLVENYNGTGHIYEPSILLAEHYLYDRCNNARNKAKINEDTIDIAEKYVQIALLAANDYAEPNVFMGDILTMKNEIYGAISYYNNALSKKYGTIGLQSAQYYGEIPRRRLAELYNIINELDLALLNNGYSIKFSPDDIELIKARRELLTKLNEGLNQMESVNAIDSNNINSPEKLENECDTINNNQENVCNDNILNN